MHITDEFRVDLAVEDAWRVLLDIERIAPCMPGAQLQEVEGDEYRGIVKVKVGPITAQYKGAARFTEVDGSGHRAVISAQGRDTRGQGNASATITASLAPDGGGTRVSIDSDVTITGKVAQFGRGVIADVSSKLLGQFVDNLERDVLSAGDEPTPPVEDAAVREEELRDSATEIPGPGVGEGRAAAGETSAEAPAGQPGAVRKIDSHEAEAVDLLRVAGAPVLKRVLPLVLLVAVAVVVVVLLLVR